MFVYQGKDNVLSMFVFSLSRTVKSTMDNFTLPTKGCLAKSGDIFVVFGGGDAAGI